MEKGTLLNVLVIGGIGFIGHHTVRELVLRGHRTAVLALPPPPPEEVLLPGVQAHYANLDVLSDEEVRGLLEGQDAVVYAAGADDRVVPKAPAYEFFYNANVRPSQRLFRLARQAGVKRGCY